MHVKRLLTAALCAVLTIVSCNMSSIFSEEKLNIRHNVVYASEETSMQQKAEEVLSGSEANSGGTGEEKKNKEEASRKSETASEVSEASGSQSDTPAVISEPVPESPQTDAPSQPEPPQTDAPSQPEPPQANAPAPEPPQTDAPSQPEPPQTNAPAPEPPQTNALSQPEPPQTDAPSQPEPPQTNAPAPEPPQTDAPSQPEPPQTESQKPTESETKPTEGQTQKPTESETKPTEGQTQKPAESETKPTEDQTQKPAESETKPTEMQTESQTQRPSDDNTEQETPEISEGTGTEQLPSETVPGTEGTMGQPGAELPGETTMPETGTEQPGETMTPGTDTGQQGPGLPGETTMTESGTGVSDREEDLELETESDSETETELVIQSESSRYSSNSDLLRHQNIVRPPDIKLEFRFTKVEADYAIVKNREGAYVYEGRSEEAREVGELPYYCVCAVLEDCGDGWYYIESRNVRGFVKAEEVVCGDTADRIVNVKGLGELPEARLLVSRLENNAYDYTHTTIQEVLAEKVYAIAGEELEIHEQRREDADVTGLLAEGALCYILADAQKDWVYIESGNARGFVEMTKLITGKEAEEAVKEAGENNMDFAEVKIEPEDNEACYYTLTSVKEASQSAKLREEIVNFALDYLGNPYVWGGTSLTNGADCSGFVQSIYAHFGYWLPRVAEYQAEYGMQIPVDAAAPGDLIFYARNGYVFHVSMYIGNGQVVHASSPTTGIITSGIDASAVWATRLIQD